jgi:serine O-acetyltransferase
MQVILLLHQLSSRCDACGFALVARFADRVTRIVFAASIPGRAKIGRNVFFHHSGLGVVINRESIIEDSCEIGVHVVLGGGGHTRGAPYLERNVIVHAGAKIIGPVRVGEGAVVAANAVVLENVPARTLAAGVPAAIKRFGIDNSTYRHDRHRSGRIEDLIAGGRNRSPQAIIAQPLRSPEVSKKGVARAARADSSSPR